jgi:hypothetical protein
MHHSLNNMTVKNDDDDDDEQVLIQKLDACCAIR